MKIEFPAEPPVFDGAEMSVEFIATVDGKRVQCAVSTAALQDFFGAKSPLEDELLKAFELGGEQIRAACRNVLERNGGKPAILRSGLFRIEQTPRSRH